MEFEIKDLFESVSIFISAIAIWISYRAFKFSKRQANGSRAEFDRKIKVLEEDLNTQKTILATFKDQVQELRDLRELKQQELDNSKKKDLEERINAIRPKITVEEMARSGEGLHLKICNKGADASELAILDSSGNPIISDNKLFVGKLIKSNDEIRFLVARFLFPNLTKDNKLHFIIQFQDEDGNNYRGGFTWIEGANNIDWETKISLVA